MDIGKSFLTEKQIKVLRLREEGKTQAEIARKLQTSRSNIHSIEKRAKENIEKAENTLQISKKIKSPVMVKIKINEDIMEGSKKLLSKADEKEIHVSSDMPELISKIRNEAEGKLEGRRAIKEIELYLSQNGKVQVS